jgi:hypothetical protein
MWSLFIYLVAGWLVVAAASRWVLQIPLRSRLTLLLLPLALSGGALLTDSVFAPADIAFNAEPFAGAREELGIERTSPGVYTDITSQIAPWRAAIRSAWLSGHWPLWNPALLCGDILAASAQSAPYYPLYLLLIWLPLPLFLSVQTSLALLVAALGAWLLFVDLEIEETAALVGAAGWALCGFISFWAHWPLGVTAAWLPLVLLGGRRVVTRPGVASSALLIVVLTMVMLAGHPETAVHLVAFGVLWAGVEWMLLRFRRPLAVLAAGLVAGVLALGLTAVYLLPIHEVLDQSAEYPMRHSYYRNSDRSVPWPEAGRHAISLAVPFVHGYPGGPGLEVPFAWSLPATSYAGSLLLPLAAVGIALGRDPRRWLLLAFGVVGTLAGLEAPGVADAVAKVPLFDVSINRRLFFLGGFSTVALAAIGLDELARHGRKAAAIGSLIVAAGLTAAVYLLWPAASAAGFPAGDWLQRSLVLVLPLVALAVVLLGVRRAVTAASLVLVLLVAQRGLEVGGTFPTLPAEAFYPRVRPLDRLGEEADPYRVVGLGYALLPATSTYFGLEDVRGYQALKLARLVQVLDLYSVQLPVWFNRVDDLERPFLDFLNVRYALTGVDRQSPPGWEEVDRSRNGCLFKNLEALPRAFVPPRIRRSPPGQSALAEMAEASEFATTAWIEDPSLHGSEGTVEEANGPGTVSIVGDGRGYRLEVDLERDAWIVVSETAWLGWRAETNGRPLPLAYANHAFFGIRAPAGRSTIELFYLPRSFVVGGAITAAALALCIVGGIVLAVRKRRMQLPELPPGSGGAEQ